MVSIALMGGLVYFKFPVTKLYSKFLQLASTSIVFSFLLSIYLFVRSRNLPANRKAEGGQSGTHLIHTYCKIIIIRQL